MRRAVEHNLDPSLVQRLRMRVITSGVDLNEPRALLARLRQRLLTGATYALSETRVEQSFNEQLFGRILGYRTLLSHDRLPYHLRPKSSANGRFDDFSLGYFGGPDEKLYASAELKGPDCDLDAPQTGNYKGKTPLEQAFSAAKQFDDCRWVLVSNFNELRLYDIRDSARWRARALLTEVASLYDTSMLLALFGREALLPPPPRTKPMQSSLSGSAALPKHEQQCQLTLRLTPRRLKAAEEEDRFPRFRVEDALAAALQRLAVLKVFPHDYGRPAIPPIQQEEDFTFACRTADADRVSIWLGVSQRAEVELSLAIPCGPNAGDKRLDLDTLAWWSRLIVETGRSVFRSLVSDENKMPALLTAELHNAKNVSMFVRNDLLQKTSVNVGTTNSATLLAGEFSYSSNDKSAATALASCLRELCVQFRSERGGIRLEQTRFEADLRATIAELAGSE